MRKYDYKQIKIKDFTEECEKGTYSVNLSYDEKSKVFFSQILQKCLKEISGQKEELKILECGTGSGFWLKYLSGIIDSPLYVSGFDLTPAMIKIAHQRFTSSDKEKIKIGFLETGDILEDRSYHKDDYDLVFCYDVIQQLPLELRYEAIIKMLNHCRKGGITIVFDNEYFSLFGFRMLFKKKVTKYLKLPLVPRYYCDTTYPFMRKLRRKLIKDGGFRVELIISENKIKRALIIRDKYGR